MSSLFAELPEHVSIAQQVREAERELAFRLSVYPRRIAAGKMTQAQADKQVLIQRAIIQTLRDVQTGAWGG
jgi:hypothetical protein